MPEQRWLRIDEGTDDLLVALRLGLWSQAGSRRCRRAGQKSRGRAHKARGAMQGIAVDTHATNLATQTRAGCGIRGGVGRRRAARPSAGVEIRKPFPLSRCDLSKGNGSRQPARNKQAEREKLAGRITPSGVGLDRSGAGFQLAGKDTPAPRPGHQASMTPTRLLHPPFGIQKERSQHLP